jgi:thioredoxin-like negative regulator of GroEL
LQQNPQDHAARLDLARALDQGGDVPASLGQYQALVQHEALLDNVAADLNKLAARHPSSPQVRRVLGDVLMRQGRLQDALHLPGRAQQL